MRTKFFASLRNGLPTIQFGYLTNYLQLNTRTTTGEALTLNTSDGSINGYTSDITKNFPDSSLKVSGVTVSSPNNVDIVSITSPNVIFINGPAGTCNVSAFPNLVIFNVLNSLCNKFIANMLYGVNIVGAQCDGKTLNIQGINGSDIRASGTYCQNVLWPLGASRIALIQMSNSSITQPQTITAMPALKEFYLDGNSCADTTKGIGRLDLSYNLQLTYLGIRESRINNIYTVPGMQINNINMIFCNLTQPYNGVAGSPESFILLIRNCLKLYNVEGLNIGLSSAQLELVLDELLASDASRVRCRLALGGGNVNEYYNRPGNFQSRACGPLITQTAQDKLKQVRALGHTVDVNDPVFAVYKEDAYAAGGQCRIEYLSTDADITWWAVGDTLICTQSPNSDLINEGEHLVVAGSGKSWTLSNTSNYAGFEGLRGNGIFIKKE